MLLPENLNSYLDVMIPVEKREIAQDQEGAASVVLIR
jgi:hypothetical protein